MAGNKYKIFIDGKPISIFPLGDVIQTSSNAVSLRWKGKQTMVDALENIANENIEGVLVYSQDTDVAFNQLSSRFKIIHAAGGLVKNNSGQYLFIFRRGKWDLPKGKMDEGESTAQTAQREVKEECGLKNLRIISPLPDTFHHYSEKGKNILKRTHWFLMSTEETEVRVEKEEDIEDFVWLEKEKILSHISSNTFPNILELINESIAKL
jgi:8-oxo-dGTP pyrophosphatase MutT (NUDIX family)